MKAWHFLREDMRLGYGDHRKVKVSEAITVDCDPVLCEAGLHGSVKPLDALNYSPGPIVCIVEINGTIFEGADKICGTSRKCIAMADATNTLHVFACWCAKRALRTADHTDERAWDAISTKLRWLKGEATDNELAAASAAASAAAWAAASAAARDAAWDAQNNFLEWQLNRLFDTPRGRRTDASKET